MFVEASCKGRPGRFVCTLSDGRHRPCSGSGGTQCCECCDLPVCWQLLTRWPRTQASQANFSPSIIMVTRIKQQTAEDSRILKQENNPKERIEGRLEPERQREGWEEEKRRMRVRGSERV